MELTRFYIQLVKDPHGPDVGLFIGNLPVNLSQRKYENIINEFLDDSAYHCIYTKLINSWYKVSS